MRRTFTALVACMLMGWSAVAAQGWPTEEPVLRAIWQEGVERSQVERLSQVLLDSVGPRLTGTPQARAAQDWLVATYRGWGVEARLEQYGTWGGWRRGITHIDLLTPRVRTLEGTLLGWSAGTRGRPVQGSVIVLPEVLDEAAFRQWLPSVRGRFVAIDMPQPTCRPDRHWREFGAAGFAPDTTSALTRLQTQRRAAQQAWTDRRERTGLDANALRSSLEEAGAAGILQSNWSNETGINKVFTANTRRIPTLDLSCEDYGLVFRLAENRQGPTLRVVAEGEHLGEVPLFNVIAEIRGTEKPEEVVLLSAHFDSFDGASGATDNGTGTVTMLEAVRILRQVYPNPRRTIMVGHWNSEEQGLNGSRAFAEDHPEIVENLHVSFNQDNGTGRIQTIGMMGLMRAGEFFARWVAQLPAQLTRDLRLNIPGAPSSGGSDHAAFICSGAPAFGLGSLPWDYFTYTWHTNRDTYDKLVFEDLRQNAVLVAMLTYLAAEEEERMPRERRTVMAPGFGGQTPAGWPECRPGARRQE